MEIRDVYDINKNLTGETYKKGEKLTEGKYALIVITFIQNSKGEFLIQYTSEAKGHEWSSTGGHPKSGESSRKGIRTEVLEELGVDIDENEFEFVTTLFRGPGFFDIYYVKKDIDIKDIVVQDNEVEKVKWATVNEIDHMIENGEFQKTHTLAYKECIKFLKDKLN